MLVRKTQEIDAAAAKMRRENEYACQSGLENCVYKNKFGVENSNWNYVLCSFHPKYVSQMSISV